MKVSKGSFDRIKQNARASKVKSRIMRATTEIAFDDLEIKNQDVVNIWLIYMINLGRKPVNFFWSQIPAEFLSDDLLTLAVRHDCSIFQHIVPKDPEEYIRLFMVAFRQDFSTAQYIHQDYRNAATVEAMLDSPGVFEGSYNREAWVSNVMTPELIERASLRRVTFMGNLPRSQVSQAALDTHLEKGYTGYYRLRGIGRLKLAAEYMQGGHWPEPDGFDHPLEKPRNARGAFLAIQSTLDSRLVTMYMVYLMTQPIEEVIGLMGNHNFMFLVKEMYTEDELRPLMKTNIFLRGSFLEDALGL